MACSIEFTAAPIYSLAFQQNQYPLVTSLTLTLDESDEAQRNIKTPKTNVTEPEALEILLNNIPGVVDNGIFAFNKPELVLVSD